MIRRSFRDRLGKRFSTDRFSRRVKADSLNDADYKNLSDEDYEDFFIENFKFAGGIHSKKKMAEALNNAWSNRISFEGHYNSFSDPEQDTEEWFESDGVEIPSLLNYMMVYYEIILSDDESNPVAICSIKTEDHMDIYSDWKKDFEIEVPIKKGSTDEEIARDIREAFLEPLKSRVWDFTESIERLSGRRL